MPVKSPKQFRFMEAAAHGNMKSAGGPSPSVAKEFLSKTPESKKKKFAHAVRSKMGKKKPVQGSGHEMRNIFKEIK